MKGNLYYQKHIEKLINANPTIINITRMQESDDGYGGVTLTPKEISETVTFYQKRANRELINESGISVGYMASSIEKILTKSDADIIKGDMFIANGREYKVQFVNPYFDICNQVEVGVVKDGV